MWAFTTVAGAFALALLVASVGLAGGAVVVTLPLALLLIVGGVLVDMRRRRNSAASMREYRDQAATEKVDFTERDRETLVSE
jgi:hypothetical protein